MDAFFRTLPGIFEAIEASDEVRQAFVFAAWKRVAGAQLAERTAPVAVDGKRLVIAVADRMWKRNLETLASQLLFRLNAVLGRPIVDFIEFRIDPAHAELTIDDMVPEKPYERRELPSEIFESAASIKDDQLRKAVLNAAANCLSRKR